MINLDRFFTQSQIAFALLVIAAALAYLAFGRKMPKKKQKKGNILVILLITTVVILSLAAAGYLFVQNRQLQNQTIKPVLPIQNSAPTNNFPTPTPVPNPTPVIDPTANWKTYNKNFSAGNFSYPTVEIKYPSNWSVSEQSLEGTADKLITFKDPSGASAVALQISIRDFLRDYDSQKQYLGPLLKENLGVYTPYRFKNKYGYIDAYYFPSKNGYAAFQLLNEKFRIVWNQSLSTFKFLDQNSADSTTKMTVKVFFNNKKLANDPQFLYCDTVFPVNRTTPYTQAVALAALNEWLKGPTVEEKAQGYSGGTGGDVSINSIKIINGQVHVDLHFSGADDWVVNARKYLAGTCGISSFLSQIGTTVEQFPTVTAKGKTIFSIDGSEEKFNGLAQNP